MLFSGVFFCWVFFVIQLLWLPLEFKPVMREEDERITPHMQCSVNLTRPSVILTSLFISAKPILYNPASHLEINVFYFVLLHLFIFTPAQGSVAPYLSPTESARKLVLKKSYCGFWERFH